MDDELVFVNGYLRTEQLSEILNAVSVVYADDELVMRLQDNCPMFDVERYIAQEIDRAEDIRLGLKITGGLADDISYVHSLGNNNVIIRFPNS
ncbi:MAG: hypothetical protein K6F27_10535 [Ruminococcus sp.]|nr:hypothetical protein [Ruminococcus sp.]